MIHLYVGGKDDRKILCVSQRKLNSAEKQREYKDLCSKLIQTVCKVGGDAKKKLSSKKKRETLENFSLSGFSVMDPGRNHRKVRLH